MGTHARCITSSATDSGHVITVDDDGAGLAAEMREAVLQRGVRADEAAPGSGLGLAIVRDLAELYGWKMSAQALAVDGRFTRGASAELTRVVTS